jgi:hypothetical protein
MNYKQNQLINFNYQLQLHEFKFEKRVSALFSEFRELT